MGGPLTGLALKLGWIETTICSIFGMMSTVVLVVFASDFLNNNRERYFPRKGKARKFTKTTRLAIKIRQRFGLIGISFLTPVLFTPPLGAYLAVAFRYKKQAIISQMFLSAVVWGVVLSLFFFYLKDLIF